MNALGPYKAEDEPGTISTLSKSSGLIPTKFPVGKFRSGADVSIPSTSCTNLVFASVAKPLVLTAAKFRLPLLTLTPLMCSS